MRGQKNHSGKLQSANSQLKHDNGIKEPENARDQSIVNLQETDRCADAPNPIKKIAVALDVLDFQFCLASPG